MLSLILLAYLRALHPLDLVPQVLHFMVFLKLIEHLVSLNVYVVGEVHGAVRVAAQPLLVGQVGRKLLAKLPRLTGGTRDEHMGRVDELVRA